MKKILIFALTILVTLGMKPILALSLQKTFLDTVTQKSPSMLAVGRGRGMKRKIARGASLHGTNGLIFDSDNRLYIASLLGREIVIMSPNTGRILSRFGLEQGVEGPDDLAFGPDGSLYWTSFFTGKVGRLSADGQKSIVAQLSPGVDGITFSDDGRLFVSLVFLDDALYELDPEGKDEPRLIKENLGGLNGMDFGPDGLLYGPLWFNGQIVSVNIDQGTVNPVADGLGIPAAVKFNSKGQLHVVDHQSGEVLRIEPKSGNKKVLVSLRAGLDNLAFDSRDRLFVSSSIDGFIAEVFPGGIRPVSKGGMILPGGVAVLSDSRFGESLFIADLWSLREFNRLTGLPVNVNRHFIGFSPLMPPFTVSADGFNLIISSAQTNTIQVWDPETQQVVESHSNLAVPLNAIRFKGDLVAAELMTGCVVRVSDHQPLASGFIVPAGLAATENDLWVGDWGTGIIWQIVADGQILIDPLPVATDLSQPEGLAVQSDECLVVVESGAGRLSQIDLTKNEVKPLAEGLELGLETIPGTPPTGAFNGVAVCSSGVIYVTGDIENVIYRINPPNRHRPWSIIRRMKRGEKEEIP